MADDPDQPQRNPRQPEPVRFDDPRHARVHELLSRIGEGPASMYRDIRRLISGDQFVENPASVLIHYVRELKSSIKDVLLPANFKAPEENGDAAVIDAILTNLGLPPDHAIGTTWKKFKPHEIVHRRSLGRPLQLSEVQADAAEFERILAMLLDEMERSYALVYNNVDALLAKRQPGRKDVSKLLNRVPQNGQALGYFYSKADVDGWLEPLYAAGVFADPPPYTSWPAMHFLKRAAEVKPERISEMLASLPVPEHSMHQMQYLDVVEVLPIQLRPALLLRFVKERKAGDDFVIRDLVDALPAIAAVDADTALAITAELLTLHVTTEKRTGSLREIEAAFDVHTYGDVVHDAVPAIVAQQPNEALQVFARLLAEALTEARDSEAESDLSGSWRPSIAPHEQNRFFNPIEFLGDAVITAAEAAVRADPGKLDELAADLLSRDWMFFKRLGLHLLTEFGDPTADAVQSVALGRDNLQQYDLRREYHVLVSKVAPHLSTESRDLLIQLILEGPDDVKPLRERDPEYAADYHERWIRNRLAWIAEVLPADVRSQYEEMVARLGPYDETDDFTGFITEWSGPQSPASGDDLSKMDVPALVRYLRDWQPGSEHFGPTREGLGRELQRIAQLRAGEFSAAAKDFAGLDATYVRCILSGFEEAVKAGESITWDGVLMLCEWAVAQPREIPGRTHRGLDNDPHWGWARGAVASLLQTGLLKEGLAPDQSFRERIWNVLDAVMSDPDPDEERDEQLRDPTSTAINSTRGRALEAVMRFILWLRGGVTRPEGVDDFEDMPEVRALLDHHLDPAVDPSPAIRAVYGKWLFFLDRLAPVWLEQKIPALFPEDDADLEDAALDAFVLYGQYTSDRVRALLDAAFGRAVSRLKGAKPDNRSEREAPRRLGQQFVLAYLAGKETNDEGSLLLLYFAAADVASRADALAYAVHQLKERDSDIDTLRARVIALWEWRAAVGDPRELAAFGRWVGNEQLDPSWRLDRLEDALTRAGGLDYEYDVMPVLATLASTAPAAVLRCAKLAIATADRWRLYSYVHNGDMRRILETAFATGDRTVQIEAKAIANILVAHDFLDFRDLAERDLPPLDAGPARSLPDKP
jgi:hypothetical protein